MKKTTIAILCSLLSIAMYGQSVQNITYHLWDDDSWGYPTRESYTYDGNGYEISFLQESWNNATSVWENTGLISSTNNGDGTVQTTIAQYWDSQWLNAAKVLYTYTGQNVETITRQSWLNGSWQNSFRESYTYDGSGYPTSILNELWDDGENDWENSGLTSYTNNGDGTVQEFLVQSWNNMTNSWEDESKTFYTYSGQNIETTTYQSWVNDAWQYLGRATNTYDGNGYLISFIQESWGVVPNSWQNSAKVDYTNNGDGTIQGYLAQFWDSSTSSWKNSTKAEYTYSTTTGIDDKKTFRLVLYPNPSTDRITIELEGNNETSYSIYDTQGKLVQSDKFSGYNADIDISTLSPNLYFFAVQQKDKKYTTQFIKK